MRGGGLLAAASEVTVIPRVANKAKDNFFIVVVL